ncbi:MAG: hypothetical protein QM704_19235 [Anaeromyxobacteraceae bacterium]
MTMLLKSWAMPPASRPTLSSRCAWWNCCSSRRCSVTSTAVSTTSSAPRRKPVTQKCRPSSSNV